MTWRELAACKGMGTELFFPPEITEGKRRGVSGERERVQLAKKTCEECPVRGECLDFALGNEDPFGIWGGLTPKERLEVRRQE